jgi:hypothetical protein
MVFSSIEQINDVNVTMPQKGFLIASITPNGGGLIRHAAALLDKQPGLSEYLVICWSL